MDSDVSVYPIDNETLRRIETNEEGHEPDPGGSNRNRINCQMMVLFTTSPLRDSLTPRFQTTGARGRLPRARLHAGSAADPFARPSTPEPVRKSSPVSTTTSRVNPKTAEFRRVSPARGVRALAACLPAGFSLIKRRYRTSGLKRLIGDSTGTADYSLRPSPRRPCPRFGSIRRWLLVG